VDLDKSFLEGSLEAAQKDILRLRNLVRECLGLLQGRGMQTMDKKLKSMMEADAADILLEYPDAVDLGMPTCPPGVPRVIQRELDQISQAKSPQSGHLQAAESQYSENDFDSDAWLRLVGDWQTEEATWVVSSGPESVTAE
jgi:hypothetical protein